MKQYRNTRYWVKENGEIWSKTEAYEGKQTRQYITKSGEIRTYTNIVVSRPEKWKKMKWCNDKTGYPHITVQRKKTSIHRIVAECYLGPCPDGYEVDHIDGDKTNNHISNLQYLTPEENKAKRCYS